MVLEDGTITVSDMDITAYEMMNKELCLLVQSPGIKKAPFIRHFFGLS